MIPAYQQFRFWLIATGIFMFLVWLLRPMLLPFVAGLAIAYFLNPVVKLLGSGGLARPAGAAMVLLGFIILVVAIMFLIVPLFESQVTALIHAIPGYADRLQQDILPKFNTLLEKLSPEDREKLRLAAGEHLGDAINWVGKFLKHILSGGFALLDILTLVFITPLVAFYLLRDWEHMTRTIDQALPRRYYDTIRAQLRQIDTTLAGFVRGQALVCVTLGVYYASALSLTGLNFGVAIGLTTGLLSFIPYAGTTFGWAASLLLAAMQFGDLQHLGMIVIVFAIGQIIESYFLTPKLVGDRVGLHPVWILFALLAGASLLGFTGMLIAVPVAAIIGVLTRFGLQQYRNSKYYQDIPGTGSE
ncbi:MAG: AI-2E family transporter [Alphaproteobacteria bacterium]